MSRFLPLPHTSLLGIAFACALSGCVDHQSESPSAAYGDDVETVAPFDPDAVTDWPAIHLDQVQERVEGGENAARLDYQLALENCRKTGWPIRELSESELERLGTHRVRMWISPELEVIRSEEWRLAMEEDAPVASCLFRLLYQGRYSYVDGSRGMSRPLGEPTSDGDAGTGMSPGGEIPPRYALDPPDGVPAGFSAVGTSRVAGHPCRAWRGPGERGTIEQCLWSGGRSFGFDDHDAGEGCSPGQTVQAILGTVILSQEPVDGDGCRIRTSVFSVGGALDRAAYSPPEGE